MRRFVPLLACFLTFALCSPSFAADSALEQESEESTEGEPATHRNEIQWTTATEVDNFGYDVYRGTSEDGPFERLNENPIPGAGTTDEPTSYSFIDDDLDPYQTYWYYLESISMTGVRERFSPIFRKKPKLPRDED